MSVARVRFTVFIAILSLSSCLALSQNTRPKVGIKTFANPSNYSRSTIGNGLTDILSTELSNTGKFNIIDRQHVDELTKEIDFGASGYGKKSSFAQKGNLLGAEYLLMGEVTNFSYTEQRGAPRNKVNLLGPNTIVIDYIKNADVRVDFHLIDVSTGEHVVDEAGIGHASAKSETSEFYLWQQIISGSGSFESSSSLIGKATTDAVKDVVRKLSSLSDTVRQRASEAALNAGMDSLGEAKGEVAAEEGGGLWILGGIGSANGLRVGDHLRLVHENVVKDKSGNIVYRKPMEIGSMEVTDVSQPDHAEARFLPAAGAAPVSPKASDIVTVDIEYAKKLRGAPSTTTASQPAAGASNSAPDSNSAQLQQSLKRADGYMRDHFWPQALDEFQKAAASNPNDLHVLEGQAVSHYALGDFLEADAIAEKLLAAGGTLRFPIAHFHSMGLCTGEMTIQHGKLAYTGGKGDDFDIPSQSLSAIEVRKIAKGMMANEKLPDWPMLHLRFRDSGGHEEDYQMMPYMYSTADLLSGKNLASAFPMGDSDVSQMQKFEESIVALVGKYVK